MADDTPRFHISQGTLQRRFVGRIVRDVKDTRLFLKPRITLGHGRTLTQPCTERYSRSIARQPMSDRWKPPGQSMRLTAA